LNTRSLQNCDCFSRLVTSCVSVGQLEFEFKFEFKGYQQWYSPTGLIWLLFTLYI